MNIQRATSVNELLAKLIFLIVPTVGVGYFLLWNANTYYSILQNQALQQSTYFLLGMVGALVFYAFRFRFISSFLVLLLGFYFVYKGLDKYAIGEFDSFFITVRFLIFGILFIIGWVLAAALARMRYAHFIIAAVMLCASILLIAKQKTDTLPHLFQAFLPAVFYCFYIIFAAEQIYNYKDKSQRFWWFMIRRLFFFLLLVGLLLGAVAFQMHQKFEEAIANANGAAGKDGDNGMLKKNKDGSFNLKDYSQLRDRQGRSNQLLFAAHINNVFPGTDIPNPLYLTAFYYTKFDTSTETFERDTRIPKNDLFEPDPSKISMYSTRTDSSVIHNGMGDKLRKTVEVEVYSKDLSPDTYLAPNIGFFVQPIAIEKDFRKEFKTAFRAKGYVSELNSAYFVYNAKDPQIRIFQEQRFQVLRKADGYAKVDKAFLDYYTKMPTDAKFQRIAQLGAKIAANATTTVDKVLAIRDYFLSKDEDGKPLFSYTDNPSVPDIPSASKLMYFLFDNHKGYCAYYAGATLFLLRSMGIPSRITVGFMTVDRSDKNKGWYWYYANQAHAWVQVYFPGYGWLDFDTTVGNGAAQESPKPDGTPPMQPPHAWLTADGVVENVDTLKKIMTIKVGHVMFHDKEYMVKKTDLLTKLDVHIANIQRDSVDIPLHDVRIGDSATAVSYAEVLKNMGEARANEDADMILARVVSPIPIDDVYLKKNIVKDKEAAIAPEKLKQPISYRTIIIVILSVVLALCLLFLLLPACIMLYYRLRVRMSKNVENAMYWQYKAIGFYMNQLGIFRGTATPFQYAQDIVDTRFGTQLSKFMTIYLKHKYAHQILSSSEADYASGFMHNFMQDINGQMKFKQRLTAFLMPLRALSYFIQ
jgi:protein-glutamine gamma-glutamyltransferase